MTSGELTWDPHGPGQWYYSAEHLSGPVSTLFAGTITVLDPPPAT